MKSASIVLGTLAALALALLAGRYASGHWVFYTVASLQIHGAVVAFLLTDAASYLSGAEIPVDGAFTSSAGAKYMADHIAGP